MLLDTSPQTSRFFSIAARFCIFNSLMASVPPTSTIRNPRKSLGFVANALKRKDSFIQFIAMTGILLLSMRSLGQKYRLHHLQEDMYSLKEEQDSLTERMKNIKNGLLEEAAKDSTGAFAARLRVLFGSNEEQN